MLRNFLIPPLIILASTAQAINLPPKAIEALEATAACPLYQYKIVEKETILGTQTVVLFGETHIKDRAGSDLGKNVITHFNLFGLEGLKLSRNAAVALQIIYRILGGLEFPYPSSIQDFRDFSYSQKAGTSHSEATLLKVLVNYEKDPNTFRIENSPFSVGLIPDQEAKKFVISLGYAEDSTIGFEDFDDFINRLRIRIFENKAEYVNLEMFEPMTEQSQDFNSYLELAYTAVSDGTKIFYTSLGTFVLTYLARERFPYPIADEDATKLYAFSTLGIISPVLTFLFRTMDFDNKAVATIEARDIIMAKRIDHALQIRPNAKAILVLVGMNHLPGIGKSLITDYGYHEVGASK